MFSSLTDTLKLSSGYEIPCVGFGTYLTPDGDTCVNSVKAALAAGYRHIDTAEFYMNEDGVGRGIARSGVPAGTSLSPPRCGTRTKATTPRSPHSTRR